MSKIQFNSIILDLEKDSRSKLEILNPHFDQFAIFYNLRDPGNTLYETIEIISDTIYSWKADGSMGGVTRGMFETASFNLTQIQREYDEFIFLEYDNGLDLISEKLKKYPSQLEKLEAVKSMLTELYVKTINEERRDDKSFINLEQIKFLIGLRDDIKNAIDNNPPIIVADKAVEMETAYREVYNDKVELVKSSILKIVVEEDVSVKLYDQLSKNIDHTTIHICRRKDFGPGGNFDIVITKDKNNVTGRQIHFAPCNFKNLIILLESIVNKDVKRAKFVQAIRPNAWYNDQIGKEFFVTMDDLDRPIALLIEPKNVWQIDARLLKDKYVDIFRTTRVKKIEAKQIPKGSIVKWD